jgi:hypothetical protein
MAIGVTDFIQIDEVRHEIDSTYPNPGTDATSNLSVPNNGYSHKLIGQTVEFLCKVWLYRNSDEVIRPAIDSSRELADDEGESWSRSGRYQKIPEIAVTVFDGKKWEDRATGPSNQTEWDAMNEDRPGWDQRSPVQWTEHEGLSKIVNQFVQTGMNTDGVAKAALLNAGWQPPDAIQSWINREAIENELLREIEDLFSLLRTQGWGTGEVVFEKPRFGNYRHILPGEGDFIVDDLLVDIKTTERNSFTNAFWRQLLLYYVLNDIQRELYDAETVSRSGRESFTGQYPEITRVGIYFARHGELQTVEIDELIEDTNRYEEFRAWLVDRAIEENRHAQINYSAIREVLTELYDYERQQSLTDF